MKQTDKTIYFDTYISPLGKITLASDKSSLVGLWLDGQTAFYEKHKDKLTINNSLKIFTLVKSWLNDYFNGKNPKIDHIPMSLSGSPFETEVWRLLCNIPYGKTTTYGELANKVAKILGKEKMSAQAVGGAVGRNPISIIIPCHRVIGKNGNLVGYAGGLHLKKQLLDIENAKYNT